MKYSLNVMTKPDYGMYVDWFDTLEECQAAVYRFRELVRCFNQETTEVSITIHNLQIEKMIDVDQEEEEEEEEEDD